MKLFLAGVVCGLVLGVCAMIGLAMYAAWDHWTHS